MISLSSSYNCRYLSGVCAGQSITLVDLMEFGFNTKREGGKKGRDLCFFVYAAIPFYSEQKKLNFHLMQVIISKQNIWGSF
jgi:hypothetical protein